MRKGEPRDRTEPSEYSEHDKESPAAVICKRTAGSRAPQHPPKGPPHNPRLCIYSNLEAGINPAKIGVMLNIPASTVQYHLAILKRQGIITKVGYGTWEVLKPLEEAVKRTAGSTHVGRRQHPKSRGSPAVLTQADLSRFTQDAVRAHAFVFTLRVPASLRNWNNKKREQYLDRHAIEYKHLGIGGGGQRIIVEGKKVWLTNKSIIIYDRSSYFADLALDAKNAALATHHSIIKHVERLLHTDFMIGSDYKFKVSRQHYALMQNALAQQYGNEGEKLEIRTGKGLWFLIDNSYNLHEAETVHPSTAMSDNRKVQDFFNGVKATGITPETLLELQNRVTENQMSITENQTMFAANMASHIAAVQSLSDGVRDMNGMLEMIGDRK